MKLILQTVGQSTLFPQTDSNGSYVLLNSNVEKTTPHVFNNHQEAANDSKRHKAIEYLKTTRWSHVYD
jgi:hypothetical protein